MLESRARIFCYYMCDCKWWKTYGRKQVGKSHGMSICTMLPYLTHLNEYCGRRNIIEYIFLKGICGSGTKNDCNNELNRSTNNISIINISPFSFMIQINFN